MAEEHRNKTVRNSPFFVCRRPYREQAPEHRQERGQTAPTGEKDGRKATG